MIRRVVVALCFLLAPLPVLAQTVSQDWKATGSKGAVAGGSKEAVNAGLAILQGAAPEVVAVEVEEVEGIVEQVGDTARGR